MNRGGEANRQSEVHVERRKKRRRADGRRRKKGNEEEIVKVMENKGYFDGAEE